MYPFNPQRVLSRVPILPSLDSEAPHRQSTQPTDDTPLNNPKLNSSPIATPALNAANAYIKKRARDCSTPFDTPARNHVIRLTTTLNRSLAKNRVQAAQLADLQRIVSGRKERQSGKHKILRGEVLIATPEMLLKVKDSEDVTESRKSKKQKTTHPSTPPPHILDPALFSDPPDSHSDDDIPGSVVVVSK